MPEILAPCGSMESVVAAVSCGADAVYLGAGQLNARRSAQNFDEETLPQAVKYCHARDVKVYFTLNTVVFQDEKQLLRDSIILACNAGVDAVIVQDLATAALVKSGAPSLPLHASTQMSVHNIQGARQLEKLGFSRLVLPRELTLAEIKEITTETSLETECFVHGALCMSVSGQCYLSSIIGGRSGNRGMCAQPCRLPFTTKESEYSLSLKDLSLIDEIKSLADAGVTSFKIEGRMKRPEYVAAAVTACRSAVDGKVFDTENLAAVFSRSGFTKGYFANKIDREMFGTRGKADVTSAQAVLPKLAALYRNELQKITLSINCIIRANIPVSITATDNKGNTATATGDVPQGAKTAPTTIEKVAQSLQKTGGTYYTVSNIKCEIDDGLMIPASALNALRRELLEQISQKREVTHSIQCNITQEMLQQTPHITTSSPQIWASILRPEQATHELLNQLDKLIIPIEIISNIKTALLKQYSAKIIAGLPAIIYNKQDKIAELLQSVKQMGITCAAVGGLGGIEIATQQGFEVVGQMGLNITNDIALAQYESIGLKSAVLSIENSATQIKKMGSNILRGIVAYGYLPLMLTRNCPAGQCKNCKRDFPILTDRLGNDFFVDCRFSVATMYNCVPLYLGDKMEKMGGVDFYQLDFTRESPSICADILHSFKQGKPFNGDKTRGLYFRKVE